MCCGEYGSAPAERCRRALVLVREDACAPLPAILHHLTERGFECSVFADPAQLQERVRSCPVGVVCLVVVHQASVASGFDAAFHQLMLEYVAARAGRPAGATGLLVLYRRDPEGGYRSYNCIDAFVVEPCDPTVLGTMLDRLGGGSAGRP